MRLFFCLIAAVSFQLAYGEDDCAPVENSSHFGEVRNQESSEWCYAFTAADLLGEKIALKPPSQISAYDMALAYNTVDATNVAEMLPSMQFADLPDQDQTRLDLLSLAKSLAVHNRDEQGGRRLEDRGFGYSGYAISMYNFKGGYCLETQIPSQEADAKEIVTSVRSRIDPNPFSTADPPNFISRETRTLEKEGGFSYECLNSIHAENQSDVLKLARAATDFALKSVTLAVEKRCQPRHKFPAVGAYQSEVNPPSTPVESIFPNLTKNLTDRRSIGISFNKCAITTGVHEDTADCHHEAIVVGRQRGHDGECKYEVRNSWGHECGNYLDSIAKSCNAANGTFWIGEKQLKSILRGVTVIP